MLAPLCSSADRRFRKLLRIHTQIRDVAGGVKAGKDDPDVGGRYHGTLFGYAGKETGGTSVRSLLIVFDAVSDTAIPNEVKRGDVVTTPPSERLRCGYR